MRDLVEIVAEEVDIQKAISFVSGVESGGIDVFIGNVRNQTKEKKVKALEFEAYYTMALQEFSKIIDQAFEKWPLHKVAVIHADGRRIPGQTAVVIAVSAAHRDAAFKACRYIIDTLKQTVPIWKKEIFEDGEIWVAAHP